MSQITNRPGAHYDTPAWVVTVLGLCLGSLGLAYLITHPEPLWIWVLEGLLVVTPAAIIVYGGYWIATHSPNRVDRWIVAGWALGGGGIAVALVVGYVLSEQLSGGLVTEFEQLVLFGALGGSVTALLAVISTQRRYRVPDAAYPDEDWTNTDGVGSSSQKTVGQERPDLGLGIPGVALLTDAAGIYRREGLRPLAASSRRFVARTLVDVGLRHQRPYHERKRTDSDDRWEMMAPKLAETDETAVDIGCASGFFTAKLGNEGLTVTGIDVDRERIETAKRTWEGTEGIEFVVERLDPENVSELPPVDVVLLLTVYHHWCEHFGRESAEGMLRELATRSNKIFFEPPGEASHRFQYIGERPIAADESIVEYYTSLLLSVFDGRVEVEHLGEAEYPSSATRTDPVFLIDCQEYTRS
ncbi:methyltransferase [Natronorarus salvus]|uniref:methyltransferase n=1 Tax=Natronorarus salvus TaxID=3117733 RepID=UPI002F268867